MHEASGDIGGFKFLGVRHGLKEDDCNHIPVCVILRKGHKYELCKELVVKGIISKFSVLQSKKHEVHIHVVAVSVLLL